MSANSISIQEDCLIRLPKVLALLGVSKATWYRGIDRGYYPPAIFVGARAVAWRSSQIHALMISGVAGVERELRGANGLPVKRKSATAV